MQPFMLTLESRAESGREKIVHTGSEFVFCLNGILEYEVEDKIFTLEAGNSLLFSARLTHRWRNPGAVVTNAIIVLSGFEDYEKPGSFHIPPSE
jgi:mannose-6-phosphate isomerase-like protein (cupin superfamily)